MTKLWTLLKLVQKNLIISIPICMLMGIALGYFVNTRGMKIAILPLTFLMVYPMMVTLNIKKVFKKGDSGSQFVALLINFGIIPFVALGIVFVAMALKSKSIIANPEILISTLTR